MAHPDAKGDKPDPKCRFAPFVEAAFCYLSPRQEAFPVYVRNNGLFSKVYKGTHCHYPCWLHDLINGAVIQIVIYLSSYLMVCHRLWARYPKCPHTEA